MALGPQSADPERGARSKSIIQKKARRTPLPLAVTQARIGQYAVLTATSPAEDMQQLGVVVDRSGSMASMRSELVEGLNAFVEAQRKVGPAKSQ